MVLTSTYMISWAAANMQWVTRVHRKQCMHGCMEKQEMENGNGHGKWKRTRKMETDTENGNECFNILVTVLAIP